MENEVIILEVKLRSLGGMIAEILQNEGIEAHLMGTSFLNTAYLVEAGLLNDDGVGWRLMVPADQEERARQIISELEESGESAKNESEPTEGEGLDQTI